MPASTNEGSRELRRRFGLSPYFPDWFLAPLGAGYRGTGQLEKARDVFEHFVARSPGSLLSQTRLACVYSELGERAKAQSVAETILSIEPEFSVTAFVNAMPYKEITEREKFAAGLLQAGLPI